MARWPVRVFLGLWVGGCDVSTPDRFTSGGLSCPRLYAERTVRPADTSCFAGGCPVVIEQFGCQLAISTDGCADAWALRANVDSSGNLDFAADGLLNNCAVTSLPEGGDLSIGCERDNARCQLDIYPGDTPELFETASFTLFDPPVDVRARDVDLAEPYLGEGYLAGAAVAGDRIWVASRAGDYVGSCNLSGTGSSELVAFDPLQGEVAGRWPAPACLRNLVSHPDDNEFLGIYSDPPFWRVGRFDEGTIIQSSTVAIFSTEIPRQIVVAPEGPFVVVVAVRGEAEGFIALIDRQTLAVKRREAFPKSTSLIDPTLRPPYYLTAVAFRENAAVFNRFGQYVDIVNRTTGDLAQFFPLEITARMVQNLVGYGTNVNDERIVWSGFQRPTAMFVSEGDEVRSVVFYEGIGQNYASAIDPYDPTFVIVSLFMSDRTARVARLDPEAPRFLPGSTHVGEGIISDLLVGPGGLLWAVLPDEGTLVRLTERVGN